MLSVWLPLNGDLRNQGLSNITVTNNGATVDNNGKIGKCYSFDGNDDFISISCSDLYNTFLGGSQPFSIAFWVYHADTTRAIIFGDYGLSGAIGFNIELTTGHLVRFYWNGTPDKIFNVNASVGINTWTHIIITYDGNEICIYKNGVQQSDKYSGTLEAKSKTSGVFYLGKDYRTGTTALNGKLNDFRIYDHCLSPRECKQVSTALVLHYPLAMPGQENLLVPQISDNKWANWNANATWNSTNTREKILGDDGKTWAHIIQNTTDGYGGYTCGPSDNQIVIDSSKRYTWSCIAKAGTKENAEIVLWYHWRSTEGGANLSQSAKKFQLTSNPQRISWTLPQYTNDTYTVNRINLMMGTHRTGNNEIYFTDVKFEEGSRPTTWLPNPTDTKYAALGFNDGIEYDVSGYGNNGTRNGTFSWSSDTPRYNTSTYINSSSSINHPRCLSNDDQEWTCCAWVKLDNSTSHQQLNNFNKSNSVVYNTTPILYLNEAANDYYMYGSQIVPVDEWTHIAFVFKNSTGLRNIYINGILKNNYGPNKTSTPYGIPDSVTLFGQNFVGYVSDYREYATALSQQDVRDLYAVGASLSDTGVLFSNEVSEV